MAGTLDETVVAWATSVSATNPGLLGALQWWHALFQPYLLVLATTLACAIMAQRHRQLAGRAAVCVATVWACWFVTGLIKVGVARPRPDDRLVDIAGWSFPSGHASAMAVCCAALIVACWPVASRGQRVGAVALSGVLCLLTSADRVFLGVHYPSDVMAGTVLGLTMMWVAVLAARGRPWWALSLATPRSPPP